MNKNLSIGKIELSPVWYIQIGGRYISKGQDMLIRAIFWFSLVVMLVPVKVDQPYSSNHASYSLQVIAVAKSFIGDISGFCHRNPGSCATSRNMVSAVSTHMRYQMYQWVKVFNTGEKPYPVDSVLTGSIKTK